MHQASVDFSMFLVPWTFFVTYFLVGALLVMYYHESRVSVWLREYRRFELFVVRSTHAHALAEHPVHPAFTPAQICALFILRISYHFSIAIALTRRAMPLSPICVVVRTVPAFRFPALISYRRSQIERDSRGQQFLSLPADSARRSLFAG